MFVFPMAGLSNRFTKAGYNKPKYMLDAGGRTLFARSISGFSRYFETDLFMFIYLKAAVSPNFIRLECKQLGIPLGSIILCGLAYPTDGQATTVAAGLEYMAVGDKEPLTVFNIDTIYSDFEHPVFPDGYSFAGYLDVFEGDGHHWSFVKPFALSESTGLVQRVVEKERISSLCSSGLYHFSAAEFFTNAFEENRVFKVNELQGNERYIAPLYDHMIAKGENVFYRKVPPGHIQFSGTPDEYINFTVTNRWNMEKP